MYVSDIIFIVKITITEYGNLTHVYNKYRSHKLQIMLHSLVSLKPEAQDYENFYENYNVRKTIYIFK